MLDQYKSLFPNFKAQEVEEAGSDGFSMTGTPGQSDYGRFVIQRSELNGVEVIAAEDWLGNKMNVVKRVIVVNPR